MNVLVVEDDNDLGVLMSLWLNGSEIVVLRTDSTLVSDDDILWCHAALVDYNIPHPDGCELLKRIEHTNPGARRILWTASPPPVKCSHAHLTLNKPNSLEEVERAIHGG